MAYDKNNFDPKAAAEARKKEMEEITTKLEKGVKDIFGIILFAIMLFAMTFTEASPVILVVLSAVAGIVVKSVKAASSGKKGGNEK